MDDTEYGMQEASTKHEQIIKYIEGLTPGSKISVRKIAGALAVSEGTAYRAIKEADTLGLVATKERVGTVRVEKKLRDQLDKLTFAEVVNMVDGEVLGGRTGLEKTLHKFVIGAMEEDAMMRYIDPGSLLIVGNRSKAHSGALEHGAGVLITGGFGTSEEVRRLADQLELPIISSSYDTFTVASMINRAIYDRLIKKKILLIEDIIPKQMQVYSLKANHTLKDWQRLHEETGHSRFPVVDEWNRVIGMITSKDLIGAEPQQTIDKLMTRGPVTAGPSTSVASAAHMMVWEGIELLPIIDMNRKVTAVISRKDVLKAMQHIQRQPQHGETFEDLIWSGFAEVKDKSSEHTVFRGTITPQMTNRLGTVSEGVLTVLMTQAAYHAVQDVKKGDLVLDNMSSYFVKPVQIDSEVEIRAKIIEVSRKFAKTDVEIFHGASMVAKSMLTAQVIEQG
ncbi:DRTGG domain-containing protein [Paenibacillus allorhizosphaerae]|uniref:Inosine-5'-monophosphate dehydrogenase n=1 Tax=Paenibacillus allorhizosphaerae TaxID=2849866 RepID=A0ABN7THZ5_9BACL|nr:DRTGG domain-containing protein [Paenibacillus allorhizosphaerae]CAG7631068.1 Inosine-5'-monophosphate dehydrogenase [Paenibacillus allorhizosphaerae]